MEKQLTKNDLENKLKLKQLQITTLLNITQAINTNINAEELYNMYREFLTWHLQVNQLVLLVKDDQGWTRKLSYPTDAEIITDEILPKILAYDRPQKLPHNTNCILDNYEYVIPVFHKQDPIAYSLITANPNKEEDYEDIQLLIATTNIIAVAAENKRLFKRQLEQQGLQREMELAADVQKMLIPEDIPKSKYIDTAYIYHPHYNVGGDYIDIIKFDEDRLVMCIADVTGKGVGAAMLMANFQAVLRNLIFQYKDLATLIVALNEAILRITKGDRFITFFICEIDAIKKQIKYINAGHPAPLLYSKEGYQYLHKGCTLLGVVDTIPKIEEEILKIHGESTLFAFTDGLYELKSEKGVFLDESILEERLKDAQNRTAQEFNDRFLSYIKDFIETEDFPDDIAILTCKINIPT